MNGIELSQWYSQKPENQWKSRNTNSGSPNNGCDSPNLRVWQESLA